MYNNLIQRRAYPTPVVEVGKASLFLAYMIFRQVTFLHERPFKFILRSNYFPIHQRAMLSLRYLRTNQNNTMPGIIISFGTTTLHYDKIEFLTNIVGVPFAHITGVEFSTIACNAPGIFHMALLVAFLLGSI
ncbi:hypothetical protein Glove_209g14 [Diversispora epigaea]|uniref:Uncharacterized protein n=1 Tax=Diversispora epigaea TaxID=1348612 RepID=A0A397IIL9_9GLOM|nr:hypothetical protein Glove_209g14 [Diversispora epigaea]